MAKSRKTLKHRQSASAGRPQHHNGRFGGTDAGSNPGHDLYHFVLRFRLSFQSPGKWLRGQDLFKILPCSS